MDSAITVPEAYAILSLVQLDFAGVGALPEQVDAVLCLATNILHWRIYGNAHAVWVRLSVISHQIAERVSLPDALAVMCYVSRNIDRYLQEIRGAPMRFLPSEVDGECCLFATHIHRAVHCDREGRPCGEAHGLGGEGDGRRAPREGGCPRALEPPGADGEWKAVSVKCLGKRKRTA